MSHIRQQVIERIKQENIQPITLGYFLAGRLFRWLLVGVFLVLSTLATAFAFHVVMEIDWEAFRHASVSAPRAILMSLPLLWLLLTVLFLVLASIVLHRTGRWYRYSIGFFLFIFPLMSMAAGFSIEHSRFDEPVEKFFLGDISQQERWQKFIPSGEQQWTQPENGLLGGDVIEVDRQEAILQLEDGEKKLWEIDYRDAEIETGVELAPNTKVNIIGTETESSVFEAAVIKKPKSHRDPKKAESSIVDERDHEEIIQTKNEGEHDDEHGEESDDDEHEEEPEEYEDD